MSVNKKEVQDELQSRGNYFQGPNEIFELNHLPLVAKYIWCYISSRPSGWQSSNGNLARNLDIDERTVTKHIATLEQHNMLVVEKGPNNASNFKLLAPSKWLSTSNEAPATKNVGPHQMPLGATKNAGLELHSMRGTQEEKEGKKEEIACLPTFKKEQESIVPQLQKLYKPNLVPEVKPKSQPIFFKTVVLKVIDDPITQLGGRNKQDTLDIIINTCKNYNLTKEELSSSQLIRLVANDKRFKKEWQDDIKQTFENLVEIAYAPEIQPALSTEEQEYAHKQKMKQYQVEYDLFYSPEVTAKREELKNRMNNILDDVDWFALAEQGEM